MGNKQIETYIVDSFTNEMFKGNPAGVCIVEEKLSDALMHKIAQELNLSETAFVKKEKNIGTYSIRYFSPKMEIPLCGHATLASSRVIFEKENLDEIHFITIENLDLGIQRSGDQIIMDFPVYDTEPATVPEALLNALGLEAINNCVYNKETNILLLEIDNTDFLAELKPDFAALYKSHDTINGVLVTAQSEDQVYDFYSRYFWPWSGTNEDPVTGGTHTFLTKYWSERLNKTKMKSFQLSSRTGFMEVELVGNNKLIIKGSAVIVMEGNMNI